jgi:signal transduction histidine kinase
VLQSTDHLGYLNNGIEMFKLQRFYSLTSFIIIFVAAALLTLFYRQVTVHWIEHLAETNHQAVAQIALDSVGSELDTYLGSVADASEREISTRRLPAGLAAKIKRMTHDTTVGRIDIYNRNGLPVFSTDAGSTGTDQGDNPAFQSAISGSVSNSMIFRDILNNFEGTTEEDNLMRTYIPVRSGPAAPVMGVFYIHSDMSHLIEESNKVMLFILAGAELILALLYAILFFVVRYANNIIATQHTTIKERTASLERLSKRLLKGEELQKKKIATDLHEGLAQTLSAIKINVESNELKNASNANAQSLESIVPVLQHAIHEVRTIATELRPSSLDDLGLLPTINWFCREFERQHPEIRVRREISLPEGNIPSQLKIDIYRIVESVFKNIAKHSNTDQIYFVLHLADDMIHLIIGDTPTMQPAAASIARFDPGADPQSRFAEMKERTSLSGGVFSSRMEELGGVTLRASWACGK